MSSVPTHIKIQNEFNEIKANSIGNVVVEKSKYNVWNLTFIIEGQSYFGKIIFSQNYPVQAPNIIICTTPNLKEPKKFLYLPIIENWKASCTAKEVIHATLNVMKELDQHLNLFYSIPALNGLQIDIFRDILKFLDGPSIENCSLVSRSWENFIRIYRKTLSLRKIYALVIHQEYNTDNLVVRIFHKTYPRYMKHESYFYYSTDAAEELVKIHNFYKTPEKKMNKKSSIHIPEDNHFKISALQNCIFDEIVLDFSKFSQIWQVNYSVDLFGKLVEICGQKLKTIRLDDGKSDNLIAYASSLYPKIFNYVNAYRLDKNVLKEVDSIVSNPHCLFTIPNPPTHIELSCEEHVDYIFFNHPFEIMEINRFGGLIDLIKIFDCLIQSQSNVSRYSLQFTSRYTSDDIDIDISSFHLDQSLFHQDLDTFCEKVLSAFESTSEPGNLPSQIKIYISDGGNYDQFLQRLFDRRGNLDKKRIKHKNAKGVKFQRSDQWKITFGLNFYDLDPHTYIDEPDNLHAKAEIVMSSVPTHIKIQNEFNEIKENSIENVVVEKSKYNVWNLTFIVEGQSYFGKIIFLRNYPVQAPSIQICTTPNLKEPRKFLYLPIIENWRASCTAKEVIQATLNVMKELDQHSNLFYSALNGLQIDIFRDILKFLDGPNIENCNLVSRSWENFIRIYRKILPLRKIYALVIHQEYINIYTNTDNLVVRIFHKIQEKMYCESYYHNEFVNYNNKLGEELVKIPDFYKTPGKKKNKKSSILIPEYNHVKISALQNCIFDEIVLNFSNFSQIWQVNYSVDLFAKLVEICGQKLKTIRLDDGRSDNLIAYASSLYPKIFNYVDADRLDKYVLKEVDSIVSNPDCLFTIPNPPTHIELSCKESAFNSISDGNGLIGLIKIFDCLIQSQTDVSRYSLKAKMSDFCPVLDTFCEKVLSAFESTGEPGNLPSQIKIYINFGKNYDQFLQRLFDRRGNLDKKRIKQGYAKGIKFQRSDQWKITFGLNLYAPYTLEANELRIKIIKP